MEIIGKKVRSKANSSIEGEIVGIHGNKIGVSFIGNGYIDVPLETLDVDDELKKAILEELSIHSQSKSNSSRKHVTKQRFKNPKITTTPNMIYLNIAYMKFYKGITEDDKPYNGGSYIGDTGNAGEKYNFSAFDDEYVYGFAEPGFTKGGYENGNQKELHIENIDPSCADSDHLDNVIVIMCAKDPASSNSVIVGWYENATVYRNVKIFNKESEQRWMNVKCLIKDAHLIDSSKRTFTTPRAKQDGIGFGQSNFWYANQENDYDFRIKTLDYIKSIK